MNMMSSPGDDLWEPEEQLAQLHFFLVAQRHRDVLLFPHSDRKEIFFPQALYVQQLGGAPWFMLTSTTVFIMAIYLLFFATLNPLTLEGTDNTSLYCLHLRSCLRPSISCTKL
jgi:hypothetical protein